MNAIIKAGAIAWAFLAAAQVSASSYGCGRLLQKSGNLAAVLVLNKVASKSSDGSAPSLAASELALVVCGKDGCSRQIRLGSVRPLALAWNGRHLTLYGNPPPSTGSFVPTGEIDLQLLPMSATSTATEPLLRFEAGECYTRPSAGN